MCHSVEQSGTEKETQQRESERGGSLELRSWIDTERETQEKVKRKSERTKDLEGREKAAGCPLSSPLYLWRELWRITALIILWRYWSPSG